MFLIVGETSPAGRVLAYNEAPTEPAAAALVATLKNDHGKAAAFYCAHPGGEHEFWTADPVAKTVSFAALAAAARQNNRGILAQILALETTVTPRRVREAIRGIAGKAWLDGVDDQIAALRAQLQP